MKNSIRKKIVTSIVLTAFTAMNVAPAVFGVDDYYKPAIRSNNGTSVDVNPLDRIHNGDSIVNLSLREADIQQVLRMFADQAGMNIILSEEVSGNVTMDLVNITLERALDLVIKTNKLQYEITDNTLIIAPEGQELSLNKPKNMVFIPVKYVSASSLANFLNKNIFNKDGAPGVSKKAVVSVNPANNELIIMGTESDANLAQKIVEQFDKKPQITTFKVNHTTPAEMADLICSTLLPATMNQEGGSGGGGKTGGAASISGVPTGYASASSGSSGGGGGEGLAVGGGTMVCSIDQSVQADSIESPAFKNLTVTYFPTLGTIQIIGGSESQLEMIRDYIAENDKKAPQAYLEVQIISLSESGSKTFDNTWQFLSHSFSFNAGNGGISTNPIHPIFFAGKGFEIEDSDSYNSTTKTYDVSGALTKWSHSPQLVYTVNYLVENNKGRVLANPRVLLTSGQESTIDLTSDYVSKVTSQYLDGTGQGTSQVQKDYDIQSDNGIKVTITPFISPDGYVTLDVSPEYSVIGSQIFEKQETEYPDLVATLLQRRNLNLKGVRIKDGETLIIGGMIQESETKSVKKIPFLGDLPVIGMFFRSTGTQKSKEEMVIMLTPQILVDTEDEIVEETAL